MAYHAGTVVFLLVSVITVGCGSGSGKDSVSSQGQSGYSTSSDCLICHSIQNNSVLDPLMTNGTGTSGKHVLHVTTRGIGCLKCHYIYKQQSTHMNGTLDTSNPPARLISFDSTNPNGQWINDSGSQTGSCSNLACHGPQTPDWYGASSTLPDCLVCHTGSLDPTSTNSSGTEGKHVIHVTNRGIPCLTCHTNYTNQLTHMNGTKDTVNPAVHLVNFDATNPSGAWINDTGPSTGSCSSLACHGMQTPDWYSSASALPDCSVCHTGSLDPTVTNGSGTSGKHGIHVTNRGIPCLKCHAGYTNQSTHMNGTKDTGNPAVHLVGFDTTNFSGAWINDNGPSTGSCSSLACHGPQVPDWYSASSTLPDCSFCHTGSLDPAITNGSGTSGKHVLHVGNRGIGCLKCHLNYTNQMTHMNGTKDTINPAVHLVNFDASNPTGVWTNDTGAQTGTCSSLACHGAQNPDWYGSGASLPACTTCHAGAYAPVNIDAARGSGSHQLHLTYPYACQKCHYNYTNQPTHMNGTLDMSNPTFNTVYFDPTSPAQSQWSFYTFTCANTYCHSDGTSIATSVVPSSVSPQWYGSISACNYCHGNWSYSDWRSAAPLYAMDHPKSNSHATHIGFSYQCNVCHYATTVDGVTIADASKHNNGVYDVTPQTNATVTVSGTPVQVNFIYSFDPGGGSCSSISCHVARGINANLRWGNVSIDIQASGNATGNNCEGLFTAWVVSGGTSPYTYLWEFSDGGTSVLQQAYHVFPTGSSYAWGRVTIRDRYNHPATTTTGSFSLQCQ
jgi:predicted CxxxxCH...CXXCH cytochrome family protein